MFDLDEHERIEMKAKKCHYVLRSGIVFLVVSLSILAYSLWSNYFELLGFGFGFGILGVIFSIVGAFMTISTSLDFDIFKLRLKYCQDDVSHKCAICGEEMWDGIKYKGQYYCKKDLKVVYKKG